MEKNSREVALVAGGALVGAVVVMMLVPRTRQAVWHALEGWVRESFGPAFSDQGIEQEAAATEGGLAATRDWAKLASVRS